MLTVKLDTGFNIEISFPVSPFHRRMFAWMLDSLLMLLYSLLLERLLSHMFRSMAGRSWILTLAALPVLLYYPLCEIFTDGQSVGKKLLGIRVIAAGGGQASFSQYILRWVFRFVDFPVWIFPAIYTNALPWYCSVLAFCGIGCVLLSDRSQRIGDIVAGTMVIFTRDRTSWKDTVFTQLEEGYKPVYPEVMRISDKDINSLKGIIELSRKRKDRLIADRIAARITGKLGIHTQQESIDFLETLLKDYNYYTAR